MIIDLHLLGRIVLEPHETFIHPWLHVDSKTAGISKHLRHLFIESQHQAWLAATRALGNVLQTHAAFSNTRDAGHHSRTAGEVTTIHDFVQTRNASGYTRGRIKGGGMLAACATGCLHSTVYMDAVAVDDAKLMPAHLKIMSSRLDN